MSTPPAAPSAETPERLAFSERIGRKHLAPLWTSLAKLVTPEPVSGCQPASWSFAEIRAAMATSAAYWTAVRSAPHSSAKNAVETWCTRRMRCPGSRENDSRTRWRRAAVVMAVDSIEIVRILSIAFGRLHVCCAGAPIRR